MTGIRQGDVYWLDFGRRHPSVVVQNDIFNQSLIATTVVCLITSNLSRARAPGNSLAAIGSGLQLLFEPQKQ